MGLINRALKRIEPRVQVLPVEIKGILIVEENSKERQVPFLVWDMSVTGLGIIVSDRLLPSEVIKITFGSPYSLTVNCSVVWCELQKADYDFQEPSYRAGLITLDHHRPLQTIIDSVSKAIKRS